MGTSYTNEHWVEVPLSELVVHSLGGDWGKDVTEKPEDYETVKVIRGTEIKHWSEKKGETAAERNIKKSSIERRVLKDGDIIVEVSGGGPTQPVGRSILIDTEALNNSPFPLVCSNFCRQVRLTGWVDSAYVNYFLQHSYNRGLFNEFQTETTNLRNLNFNRFLSETIVALPPLNEQSRIVEKLDKALRRVALCRNNLRRIPQILKQFRQSILVAACSGKLTADWREANEPEPAADLLNEILEDRRRKWESDQLEKMLASGKPPKDDRWKDRYVEPVGPETDDLDELPEGWTWGTWNQISNWVTYGFTRPMPHVEKGIPIVTAKHVVNRKIYTTGTDITTEAAFKELSEKDRPQRGDILVTKDGSIGRAAIVEMDEPFCINQSVAVVWLRSLTLERKFLLYVIESPFTQRRIVERVRGNAIQHLSITDFAATPLPIPSRDEQLEIIRRAEALFRVADTVEEHYLKAKERLDKLPQSILAKAFRGELVPQDPNDEPASQLLERIRREREQEQDQSKRKAVRLRKPKGKGDDATREMFA